VGVPDAFDVGLSGATFFVRGTSGGTTAAILEVVPDQAVETVTPPQRPDGSAELVESDEPPVGAPLVEADVEAQPGEERARRRRWPWVALAVVVLAASFAGAQLGRPVPALALHATLRSAPPVAGAVPALPWPATGEAAVAVPELGVTVQSGPEQPVPIASLTKIMTGYLTLRDHPLAASAQGPVLVLTSADQAESTTEASAGATNVPVQAGERLSERQLLDGLLVHSANNLSDVLARWDAGNVPAFVAKMNATATSMGLLHTHYADASGLDPGSAMSAGDVLRLTTAAMAMPTFAAVVSQPQVTLPVAGPLLSYVPSVGTDGIVGVKSGFTQAAMGCLVLAAKRTVAGRSVLVLAVVTGQPGADPLHVASQVDVQLLDATAAGLRVVPIVADHARVANVTFPWSDRSVPVEATGAVTVLAWPGQVPQLEVSGETLHPGVPAGARVGTLTVSVGHERVVVPARVGGSLSGPSMGWRLARS
jgi:D-alanyl-D-alanine carboxypeptidase (penicillin-binding protein 5/6)